MPSLSGRKRTFPAPRAARMSSSTGRPADRAVGYELAGKLLLGQGETLERPRPAPPLPILLLAQGESQKNVPRPLHGPGHVLVILDSGTGALAEDQVEKDGFGPAGPKIVDHGGIDLPGPGPGKPLCFS